MLIAMFYLSVVNLELRVYSELGSNHQLQKRLASKLCVIYLTMSSLTRLCHSKKCFNANHLQLVALYSSSRTQKGRGALFFLMYAICSGMTPHFLLK